MNPATEIQQGDYVELLYSLRRKQHTVSASGEMHKGTHPICGGECRILIKKIDGEPPRHFAIKPHYRCDPVECIEFETHMCSNGSKHRLPSAMLDCNKPASHDA